MPSKVQDQDYFAEEPPTSIDPYEVLSVDQDANEEQIKKAYRKAALKHHPDKATGDNIATAKEDFQKIAFAYAILSDPRRRKRYDATGSTSESLDVDDDDFDWETYFRDAFKEITKEDIEQFSKTYKESDEERNHIIEAYKKGKGNMDYVYELVMTSNVLEDDERFRSIIDGAIESGEVEAYKKYTEETVRSKERRVKKAEREAKEAEEMMTKRAKDGKANGKKGKGKPVDDNDSLVAQIQKNQKGRAGFLDALEEKYSKDSKLGGKKRLAADEPSEEAFAAMGERMKKKKKSSR